MNKPECPRCGCPFIKPNNWKIEFNRDDMVCLHCGFPVSKWANHRDTDFMTVEDKT